MNILRRYWPQIFRKGMQLSVLLFVVYAAANVAWRNFKLAHNNRRLVELMEGPWAAKIYGWNNDTLALFGEPYEVSFNVLGMPWSGTVFGLQTVDPILAMSQFLNGGFHPSLLLGILLPVALALVLGKFFCSHLCPARFVFEMGQAIRRGLLRLGFPLPALRSQYRLGGFVLVGGLIASTLSGMAVWLLILPYFALSAGIFLWITTQTLTLFGLVFGAWVLIDAFLAPGFFCKNLCPTGFVLEQLGRVSLLKVRKTAGTCPSSCSVCTDVCPYALSPREETHTPACDSCGVCVSACPSKLLKRSFKSPGRSLPIVATSAMLMLMSSAGFAHHNKGLPHYGYYENYPQVPTEEHVLILGDFEIGATIFNFQGLERQDADTPNDVKIYFYIYDLARDANYRGPIDFEIKLGSEVVASFARESVDEEAVYSTRETLPKSGDYRLIAKPRLHKGVSLELPFSIDLATDKINWFVIAGIALPVLLLFGIALVGRSRVRKTKRPKRKTAVVSTMMFLMTSFLMASGASAQHDQHMHHKHMMHKKAAAETKKTEEAPAKRIPKKKVTRKKPIAKTKKAERAPVPESQPDAGAASENMEDMDHSAHNMEDMDHSAHNMEGMDHSGHNMEGMDHSDHKMEHFETEDGGQVMVMGGIPSWLFLFGIAAIILFSFLGTEWLAPKEKMGWRFNLIKKKKVYKVFKSRWFQAVPQFIFVGLFFYLIYVGLFGSRVRNLTPIAVWTVWWAGLIFAVALIGPLFCFVCPWDGLTNLVTRMRFRARVEPISLGFEFPWWLKNLYPAIILFVGLTWLELGFGVTTNPRTTAYMGLGMAGLAIAGALLYDKKRFCHHFCPVGRISGIYANFAPIEVRARNEKVCAKCTTEDCLNGNDHGYPCPTGISLKVIDDNTYCTMCTECIKSCDKNNVAINIRGFGTDLAKPRTGRMDEAWLSVSLLALTLFHGLSMTPAWENFRPGGNSLMRWMANTFGTPQVLNFSVGMIVVLAIPVALYITSCKLGAWWADNKLKANELFVQYSYSILPVAMFYHLAHNAMHLFMEGGEVIPLMSDPMGRGDDYLGTATMHAPTLMSETMLWYVQVGLILVGHIFGIVVAHRISRRIYPEKRDAVKSLIPMLIMMILLSVTGLGLMHLDMNMRVGRM